MVEIGGWPILWPIMKTDDHYECRIVVLPGGYVGEAIRAYLLSYADR